MVAQGGLKHPPGDGLVTQDLVRFPNDRSRHPGASACIRDSAPSSGWKRGRAGTGSGQFAARQVAQTRTGSSQIVRRQFVDAGASSRRADDVPQHLRRHAVSPYAPRLVDRSKDRPAGDSDRRRPRIRAVFTHIGIGTVRTWPPLPIRSATTQCSSRCWIDSTRSANSSPAAKSAPNQHGEHRVVPQLARC